MITKSHSTGILCVTQWREQPRRGLREAAESCLHAEKVLSLWSDADEEIIEKQMYNPEGSPLPANLPRGAESCELSKPLSQ